MYFSIFMFVFVLDFLHLCVMYSCFIVLLQVSPERDCCHIQASQSPPVTHSSRHFSGAPVSMGFWKSTTRYFLLILRIKTRLECSQHVSWRTSDVLSPAVLICFVSTQYNIYVCSQQFTYIAHNTQYNFASHLWSQSWRSFWLDADWSNSINVVWKILSIIEETRGLCRWLRLVF